MPDRDRNQGALLREFLQQSPSPGKRSCYRQAVHEFQRFANLRGGLSQPAHATLLASGLPKAMRAADCYPVCPATKPVC